MLHRGFPFKSSQEEVRDMPVAKGGKEREKESRIDVYERRTAGRAQ